MKIKQVLNNNVVMADDANKGTVIVVGTGIGFHKKKGSPIDEAKIQQVYVCGHNKRILELIDQISPVIFEVTEKIEAYAYYNYKIEISDEIFFLMADHISFAVKRLKEGMDLDNPFLPEIKRFFPNEYAVGEYARQCILEKFCIKIPEEEIGYICMHIINSENYQKERTISEVFNILKFSINYLKKNYFGELSEESLSYTRLITHLKYFARRYFEDKENINNDSELNKLIVDSFKEEASCIEGMSKEIEEKFGKPVTQSEKNYLVLHLRNCKELQ